MKTILYDNKKKILAFLVLLTTVVSACKFYFQTTKDNIQTKVEKTSIERGKNLAFLICSGCHYDPKVDRFIGKPLNDLPKIAGHLYSANLTHSAQFGRPSHYSDAELFYLLKTGIARNGRFMPYMMRPMMADEDINDIIDFLRSNDSSVASYDTSVGTTHINMIGKAGIRFLLKPQPYQKGITRPDEHDSISYGRYLVGIIGCYHCHSRKVSGLDYLHPEQSKGYLEGGIKLKDPQGHRLYGPNLTTDEQTGIGSYSREDFRRAVREGITPSGEKLSPPMDRFTAMSNLQVDAIYRYLRSLPAVHH